ncbi:MAG: NAD-dependent epimerase/dehydratase family protein [Planctomycetes bacterium]|nr:NAD-dependent epimerase/dehydratase family protein [Planctomycetota bacterium]
MSRTILITGVSGALARVVTELLIPNNEIIGVDVRPLPPERPFEGEFYCARYTQRKMAEIFRRHKPEVVIHLGRIRGTQVASSSYRYNQNVLGTRNLLDLSLKHSAKRVVVLSTYHVYGAHEHNHVGLSEDHPLRASQIFPQLADAVELDHAATSCLWRYRRLETVVLRPCNIVGPSLNNMISRLLRARAVPRLLGYDPMMQMLHERDAARAICLAVDSERWGIYNVAGEGAVPWSKAIKHAGARPAPIPHFMAYPLVGSLSALNLLFPKHLMDYFRYATVISDKAFRNDFGYSPQYDIVDTLRSVGASAAWHA